MNIAETVNFDKDGHIISAKPWRRLFVPLVVILVGVLGFGVGRLTGEGQGNAIKIEYDPSLASLMNTTPSGSTQTASVSNASVLAPQSLGSPTTASQAVVASKNGTKYHFPYCPGAKQIKAENKISFNSAAEAEASGYTLAGNCKALK